MTALTHATEDYGDKLCRCADCGVEETCTPATDFYIREGDITRALVCERCIMRKPAVGAHGGKVLNVYSSLAPDFMFGWKRNDVPIVHGLAQAKPGERIVPSDGQGGAHWPCAVCQMHAYTEALFYEQVADALERGPRNHIESGGHPAFEGEGQKS